MSHTQRTKLSHTLARLIYTWAFILLSPLLLLILARKKRQLGKSRDNELGQRFGCRLPNLKDGWIVHCASLGEVNAARPLIDALLKRDIALVITTSTAAGALRVEQLFGDAVQHCYLPLDIGVCMGRLLDGLTPQKLIIIEVELWPNLLYQCKKRQIPVVLVNGRLTKSSLQRYQKWPKLTQPMITSLHHVGVQSQRDYDHYLQLGLPAQQLTLTGNIKFAISLEQSLIQQRDNLADRLAIANRPVLLAASTHDPEEILLIDAWRKLYQQQSDWLLIVVPRHPQRFDAVKRLCDQHQLRYQCFSDSQPVDPQCQILVVDTLGQLQALYGLCDYAFVGGSIAQRGGHNPLEASLFGVPVMMGPHRENNQFICDMLQTEGALFDAHTPEQIHDLITHWQSDSDALGEAQCAAKRVAAQGTQSLNNTLALVLNQDCKLAK